MRHIWIFGLAVLGACGSESVGESDDPGEDGGDSGQEDGGTRDPREDGSPPGDAAAHEDADAAFPYVDFDINHVLITGQSNSVSNSGTPVLSTTQPYTNLMFDTGVMPMRGRPRAPTGTCDGEGCATYETPKGLVPLVEGDRFFDYQVETSAAGLANQISFLATTKHAKAKHDVLVSIHGRSGNTYWCLRKPVTPIDNGRNSACDYKPGYLQPFTQAMMEVESGKTLAAAAGKTYAVRGVVTIHGESDHYSYANGWEFPLDGHDGTKNAIADYADALVEWQNDYEESVKAITGQTVPVPLFVTQISGWNDVAYSRIAQSELEGHIKAPGKVLLVGPSYHLALNQVDCLHFTNQGVRRLGEYVAKVYAHAVFEGKTWEPVRPKQVTRTDNLVTVQFHVPKPPLVLDTTLVAAVANSYGFGYQDSTGGAAPKVTSVAVAGPDTLTITLSAAPTGSNKHLTYAMNQTKDTCIGTPRGARGNVRDSDDTPSRTGPPLYNWAVHFDVPVP